MRNGIEDTQIPEILRNVTIFSGITDTGIVQIYQQCTVEKRKAGDVIIREGTEATKIYIVLKGKVKIVLNYEVDPLELLELGPGHCMGEASIIGVQHHCATVVVLEDAELLALPRHVLMDIYNKDKELFSLLILNIARELARRLYRTDQVLLRAFRNKENA